MSKEIYISSTPHETRLAIVESDELTEIYYERENEYTLAGSIYNGKVTRVLPGMQSSFVDIGLERDAFLYITDFMEEAADTAEFDHSGDTPRPARVEGQRGESRNEQSNGGRDREYGRSGNERSGSYLSERDQEQVAATPATDVARASEGRGEEFGGRNDRNDRNGRGRGRGRRDRGGNFDRPSPERGPSETSSRFVQSPDPVEKSQHGLEPERQPFNAAPAPGMPESAAPELGEGAPGADGSRRWRGRRGRRRGRTVGQPEGLPGSKTQESVDLSSPALELTVPDGESEEPSSFEIDGHAPAEAASNAHIVTPLQPQQPIQPSLQGQQRDRGGRNDRSDRNQRPPRVPRGFAPRSSLYAVESAAEVDGTPYGQPVESLAASGVEPEPLILPGESLSKYRKGEEPASATAAVYNVATRVGLPDSGFKVDPNWDGGATLPGETLSRYRGGSSEPSGSHPGSNDRTDLRRSEGPGDGRNGRQNDRSRSGRRDHREPSPSARPVSTPELRQDAPPALPQLREANNSDRVMLVPSTVPAPDLQSSGPISGYAHVAQQTEQIEAHQPDFTHAELPQATAEAPTIEDSGLARHPGSQPHGSIEQIDAAQSPASHEVKFEQEYEPEGQSVSYRVDPAAPSEYRQSAPSVMDHHVSAESIPEEHSLEQSHSEVTHPEILSHPSAPENAEHLHESEPTTLIELTGEAASHLPEVEVVAPHDVTTIHSTGEMDSHLIPAEDHFIGEEPIAQGFAPGTGNLEEDFIEEEEFETASLQARGDEEFDELEEEHLDGAADLGTMIRDMSVDHITRTDGTSIEEEDDDDFEEDTLEEEETEERGEELNTPEGFVSSRNSSEEHRDQEDSSPHISTDRGEGSTFTNEGNDRRGRRDSGRRGGRDRDRGNRDSGNRSNRSSAETNGYADRQSSDRGSYSSDRGGLGERARNTGGASDRDRGRSSSRGAGRQTAQSTNLPLISELLKPGQEILCQIAKEPIAKKGARITSHIALPGRFLVFMPTVSHTGVSRKIESDQERRRLKEILLSEKGEAAGGFIVRTAAAGATEEELRSDLRFLLNLWADIKQRSESSKSPALIYHDLNLVERILRDQVTDNFSAIWVDTETEYERVLRFLQRFQPGLIRRVKLYTKETPLFEQFGITEEINKALRSKVWLKSGGSIVINQTEALVAIDINTGKYVGKTARLEDTIVKTNLDAIPEIVRQIRLRDLGGIIIIDFIDMDERKNRNRVMQALEDELKNDRAPSKILPFNDFGLVAITRKRVKQSLERTLSTTCNICTGTGMVKSPVTVCNDIYVEMRKMHKHLDRGDVMLRVNPEVVKQLKSTGTRWLQEMEEMCGKTILIKSDPSLHPEQFDIH